jgi:hypothetical protein
MTRSHYDLIVVGGTPGGIACAVRAAREGLHVLLTQYSSHLGGIMTSGLSTLDTQYKGPRAPVYDEMCERILGHYIQKYGEDSKQVRILTSRAPSQVWIEEKNGDGAARPPDAWTDHSKPYCGRMHYEPHVAEIVFNDMVRKEPLIEVALSTVPQSVERCGARIQALRLIALEGGETRRVEAAVYVDATYEGDLAAMAGVNYRVGRESRSEYGEMHAGKIFMALGFEKIGEGGFPKEAVEGKLNLVPYDGCSQEIMAGSTGLGDHRVQAYNYRVCLSCDPENRISIEKPENYDRSTFLAMRSRWGLGSPLPNNKMKWNAANLPGGADAYPNGNRTVREAVERKHRDHALGFIYFLQHDEEVPEDFRREASRWGLAKDEFVDNGSFPYEMYVREARRITGRHVFTEHDATFAPGIHRAPVHHDSIAFTEHPMDSHSVSMESVAGSRRDGKVLLSALTRPGQVPYRCLLPQDVDNLLVPVCLSASHIGWGAIRLDPAFMHIGESAGYAAALSVEGSVSPAQIDVTSLQHRLVENGVMLSFFNDCDLSGPELWRRATQFWGTKGFFSSYDARLDEPLTRALARVWRDGAARWAAGCLNPTDLALEACRAETMVDYPCSRNEFIAELGEVSPEEGSGVEFVEQDTSLDEGITRREACSALYQLLAGRRATPDGERQARGPVGEPV